MPSIRNSAEYILAKRHSYLEGRTTQVLLFFNLVLVNFGCSLSTRYTRNGFSVRFRFVITAGVVEQKISQATPLSCLYMHVGMRCAGAHKKIAIEDCVLNWQL